MHLSNSNLTIEKYTKSENNAEHNTDFYNIIINVFYFYGLYLQCTQLLTYNYLHMHFPQPNHSLHESSNNVKEEK